MIDHQLGEKWLKAIQSIETSVLLFSFMHTWNCLKSLSLLQKRGYAACKYIRQILVYFLRKFLSTISISLSASKTSWPSDNVIYSKVFSKTTLLTRNRSEAILDTLDYVVREKLPAPWKRHWVLDLRGISILNQQESADISYKTIRIF